MAREKLELDYRRSKVSKYTFSIVTVAAIFASPYPGRQAGRQAGR